MQEEIWKDITNYEGLYQVSNLGRIRSLDRIIKSDGIFGNNKTFLKKGRILKGRYNKVKKKGFIQYLSVVLIKDGIGKNYYVHKLVASAFIENPYNKKQVDHIDGNSFNNNVKNLRWCTQKENNNNIITRFRNSSSGNGCSFIYNGEMAVDIAKRNKIGRRTFYTRMFNGWKLEDAITIPVNSIKRMKK